MHIARFAFRANTVAMMDEKKISPPDFDTDFQEKLSSLLAWRRDVRRFRTDPLPEGAIEELIGLASLAPSVGNSQPWRFILVDDKDRRIAIRQNFETANADALNDYEGEQARLYASLKLSGFDQAPVQMAVFVDLATTVGHGLGKKTMPETLSYSVVGAINAMWLAARARGIGIGWVSVLNPDDVNATLEAPEGWKLVAYLCIGYPEEEHIDPELERHGWQHRLDTSGFILRR